MRTGRPKAELVVSAEERVTLERWVRRPKSAQALALRAGIVLDCGSGMSNTAVARRRRISKQMVGKWRSRFVRHRVAGLLDEPRCGAPRTVEDADIEAVDRAYLGVGAAGCHPLVDALHGRGQRAEPHDGSAHLESIRVGAAPQRNLQAVHRSAVCREGAGHCGLVSGSAGTGAGAVSGREDADSSLGPEPTGVAHASRPSRATEP